MVICISGYKFSGKDTCANYLVEKYGAVRVSLADPLKDLVSVEYGLDRASLDNPQLKEEPLLHLPVEPKDDFTRMISEFMFKEFRDERGRQPIKYVTGDNFCGIFSDAGQEKLYHTPRSLCILKGSTNRIVKSNFWVEKTFEKIDESLKNNPNRIVVVPDLRYKSEMLQFRKKFGDDFNTIRITRHESSPSNDPSERDLDGSKFDFHVDNSGILEYTCKQLDSIINSLIFE